MISLSPGALLWCLPLIYLLASIPAFVAAQASAWRFAERLAATALVVPVAAFAIAMVGFVLHAVRPDWIGIAMASLIAVLGWIIIRYSRRYLGGEPGQARYVSAMMLTLASVATVAVSHNLGLVALGWMASSIGLHYLLTFYPHRRAAQIVAHKKFLASRLADLCMVSALALFYSHTGTLSLQVLAAATTGGGELPVALHAGMALVALAAILKSAQLPVHGWLIQVMEAPTPVSALLHAGIVNLGGFVLIRLAGLLSAAPVAQAMLVIVGTLTAVLAGLVMMTRISIKVRLAWSTCAQMGFMLLECGLGLYDLAFLHLLAHSLYKAYSFLTAGEAVQDTRRVQLLPQDNAAPAAVMLAVRFAAAPVAIAILFASVLAWKLAVPSLHVPHAVLVIVGLGLAPLLWREDGWAAGLLRGLLGVVMLGNLYIAWHLAFGAVVAAPEATPSTLLFGWVAACFVALYALQAWLLAFPKDGLSKALYPWAYYGFYLDERFTRLTFRIWPVRLPPAAHLNASFHSIPGEPA